MSREALPSNDSQAKKEAVVAHLIEIGVLDDTIGNTQTPYWPDAIVERPISSGLFVNEQRTPEEIAALEAAYRAVEESQDTQE